MVESGYLKTRKYPLLPADPEQGWLPYLWLLYLFQFLMFPYFANGTARDWAFTLLGTAVFLPLYFLGYWIRGAKLLCVIAPMFLLSLCYGQWNPGACVFIIYAASFAGHTGSVRTCASTLAVILAATGISAWYFSWPVYMWVPAVIFSILTGLISQFREQKRQITRRLHMAQTDVERLAKIAERERIARDLHDLLGHTLSLIVLKSELASKLTEKDPARAAQEIREVERISRDALSQVRAAVRGFRSAGVVFELENAREALETAGIAFDCTLDKLTLPPTHESVLAMSVREAVTNVVRHSNATCCRLTLRGGHDYYELSISDDGQGSADPEGCGLQGMRERVESLGGTLDRDASRGMTITIRLPKTAKVSGVA